jgi:hypothetical protein
LIAARGGILGYADIDAIQANGFSLCADNGVVLVPDRITARRIARTAKARSVRGWT